MTPENFAYWLQGFFEISYSQNGLTQKQAEIIQDHLSLVFNKKTPDRKRESEGKSLEQFKAEKNDQVVGRTDRPVITITKRPLWDGGKYCYVKNKDVENALFGIVDLPSGAAILVDEEIATQPENYPMMYGTSNHLTGSPKEGPGLINVGRGPQYVC